MRGIVAWIVGDLPHSRHVARHGWLPAANLRSGKDGTSADKTTPRGYRSRRSAPRLAGSAAPPAGGPVLAGSDGSRPRRRAPGGQDGAARLPATARAPDRLVRESPSWPAVASSPTAPPRRR